MADEEQQLKAGHPPAGNQINLKFPNNSKMKQCKIVLKFNFTIFYCFSHNQREKIPYLIRNYFVCVICGNDCLTTLFIIL